MSSKFLFCAMMTERFPAGLSHAFLDPPHWCFPERAPSRFWSRRLMAAATMLQSVLWQRLGTSPAGLLLRLWSAFMVYDLLRQRTSTTPNAHGRYVDRSLLARYNSS